MCPLTRSACVAIPSHEALTSPRIDTIRDRLNAEAMLAKEQGRLALREIGQTVVVTG